MDRATLLLCFCLIAGVSGLRMKYRSSSSRRYFHQTRTSRPETEGGRTPQQEVYQGTGTPEPEAEPTRQPYWPHGGPVTAKPYYINNLKGYHYNQKTRKPYFYNRWDSTTKKPYVYNPWTKKPYFYNRWDSTTKQPYVYNPWARTTAMPYNAWETTTRKPYKYDPWESNTQHSYNRWHSNSRRPPRYGNSWKSTRGQHRPWPTAPAVTHSPYSDIPGRRGRSLEERLNELERTVDTLRREATSRNVRIHRLQVIFHIYL